MARTATTSTALRALRAIGLLTIVSCAKDRGPGPIESATMTHAARVSLASCGARALSSSMHFVAGGLCTRVVAVKQGPLRGLLFTPNGDLLAIREDGQIRRYRDVDHDGLFAPSAPETVVWAKTGTNDGHNCVLDGQDLYCGASGRVKRWRYSAAVEQGGDGEDVLASAPEGGRYPKLTIGVWDGFLYVASGASDNTLDPMPADYPTDRAVVRRFAIADYRADCPLQWEAGEVFVRGVRNLTAITRAPNGDLIGVDQGTDDVHFGGQDVHDDNPADPILRLEAGKAYGWPFCFYAQRIVRPPATAGTPLAAEVAAELPRNELHVPTKKSNKSDAWCAKNAAPLLSFVQAHSSVLSLAFLPPDGMGAKDALPARWRGGAFAAFHGSSNRQPSTGNKVVFLPFDRDGKLAMPRSTATTTEFPYEVVFGGGRRGAPLDGAWSWKIGPDGEDPVRPVGAAISPVDGALYVSSDNDAMASTAKKDGSIYRIAAPGH